MLSTITRRFRTYARDAFSLFMKFGGTQKNGGGGGS